MEEERAVLRRRSNSRCREFTALANKYFGFRARGLLVVSVRIYCRKLNTSETEPDSILERAAVERSDFFFLLFFSPPL